MMRTFLVLTCCLALTGLVRAENQDNDQNKDKKKHEQTTQHAVTSTGNQAGNAAQGRKFQTLSNASHSNLPAVQSNTHMQTTNNAQFKKQNWSNQSSVQANTEVNAQNSSQLKNKKWSNQSNAQLQGNTKPWKVQKLAIQKNTGISSVHFNAGMKIVGSQNWQGSNYNAFRLYTSQRHDRIWWGSHYSRIILVGGGYYYWDNGWWCPAWGYDPSYQFYAYDGPILGYNDLPPDQVIANVQAALQTQDYYHGEVDGMLGPLTRAALAEYQAAHGLYPTSAIDRPTLNSLGMA